MDPRALSRTGAVRAAVAAGATGASAVGLARLAARAAADAPAPDALVGALVLALGAVAAAVLAAGCAMLTATSCAAALGRRWTRTEAVAARLVPVVLRRALTVGVGAGLTLGLGTTALADEVDVGWAVTSGSAAQQTAATATPAAQPTVRTSDPAAAPTVSGIASAGRPGVPVASPVSASAASPTTADAAAGTVTVRAGDSLWSITAGLLPPGADDARIAAAWPLLYDANRDVVGPDPGLIHPGDVLTVPAEVTA